MNTVPSVTVIGAGNIGSAVAQIALKAGASVQVLTRDAAKAARSPQVTGGTIGEPVLGDIVVLALPYPRSARCWRRTRPGCQARSSSTRATPSISVLATS